MSVVDAVSNVLFLPFMARFQPAHLNFYFVGVGFSALLPSLLSLAQGAGSYDCVRVNGTMEPHYYPPRFSVSVFFIIVFCWTSLALGAFFFLHRHTRKHSIATENTVVATRRWSAGSARYSNKDENEENENEKECRAATIEPSAPSPSGLSGLSSIFVLCATALVNAQMNGVITSVQSYASLPYSQATYHYAITLSNAVMPLASFVSFFYVVRSLPILALMTLISSLVTAFIVYLAALSPNLIFDSENAGSALSIGSALIAAGLHSYLRVVFANLLREGQQSEGRLFWCGVFIQIGSFVGSAVMFPLVNVWDLFSPAPACRN